MTQIKNTFVLIFLFCGGVSLYAQQTRNKISEKEWDKVIAYLDAEKWEKAENTCGQYLKKFKDDQDTSNEVSTVRYMYLFCVGARLGAKEYSKETALSKVNDLKGKTILTPPREFREKGLFNCFQLSENKKDLYCCGSNKSMTIIHTFEIYKMKDTASVKDASLYQNKVYRVKARVQKIEAGGFTMPRLELVFEGTVLREQE